MSYKEEVKQLMESDEKTSREVGKLIAQKLLADPAVLQYLFDSGEYWNFNQKLGKEGNHELSGSGQGEDRRS